MNSLRRVRFSWRRRLLWVPAWVVVALAAIGAWRLYRAGFPPGATPGSAGPMSGAHVGWARQASDETAWHFSVERPELWATSQLPSGRPGGAVAIHFQVAERPRDPWSRWIEPMRCERLFETDQSNSVWSGGPAPQPMPGTVPAVQRAARLGIADEMAAQGVDPAIVALARKGSEPGRLYWPGIRANASRLGLLAALLLLAAAAWRAFIPGKTETAEWRLSHGLCPACEYPLAGPVCPECGWKAAA